MPAYVDAVVEGEATVEDDAAEEIPPVEPIGDAEEEVETTVVPVDPVEAEEN